MAQQFNAIIAEQTDHFRGSSSLSPLSVTDALPNFRAITGSAYAAVVTGGISGSFAVLVRGRLGGLTLDLAGLTAISTGGNFVLHPIVYQANGAASAVGSAKSIATTQLDQLIPPTEVLVQSGILTAGISASISVRAVLYANR